MQKLDEVRIAGQEGLRMDRPAAYLWALESEPTRRGYIELT